MEKTILNNKIKLGEIGLKVNNLERSIDYYTKIIGLNLIKIQENEAWLGTNESFIHLVADKTFIRPKELYTGLFHIAILLPNEADLGALLHHFDKVNYQIDGAGDHLYSQALYMHDPDGHGIEIYADRPKSEWTINSDGTIQSGTYSVDIDRLLEISKTISWNGIPKNTIIGHIHLKIKDLNAFKSFYVDKLKMDVKTLWHGALFVSKNGYHHHLAGNLWNYPKEYLPANTIGLLYHTIIVDNYDEIKNNLENSDYNEKDGILYLDDGNGITLRIIGDKNEH